MKELFVPPHIVRFITEKFCIDMAQKVGVAAVPGSSFFREPVDHLVRLHFAKKDETLYDALNRLENLKKLKR